MRALLLFLLSTNAFGADLRVRSLYDSQSYLPGFYIPFQVTSGASTVRDVSVDFTPQAGTNSTCVAVRDPFRSEVFVLRCTGNADAYLVLDVGQGSQANLVRIGPVHVLLAADRVPVTTTPVTEDPILAEGRRLFTNVYACANCHREGGVGRVLASATVTAATLRKGLNDYASSMTPDVLAVTDAELTKIATFLRSGK